MKNKGITLIALVVTIIVLLILAGVTLKLVAGENGIIVKAQKSILEHKKGQYTETLELIIAEERTERAIEAKKEYFAESLSKRISELDWVEEVYYLNQDGENIENPEEAGCILITTKDGYDLMIEVDNAILYAKVLDYCEKSGATCTVTYMANNGSDESITASVKKNFYLTAENEDVFSKSEYSLVGWYTSETVPEGASIIGTGSKFKVSKDIILYAVWEQKTVNITFYSNNGSEEIDNQKIIEGISTTLKNTDFAYEGYTFKEWNTKPDGTGTKYSKNQNVTLNQNIELYAIWEETITATVAISNNKITEGTAITLGGTAQANGIEKIELKYGEMVLYTENGSGNKTYNKTNIGVSNLQNLGSLPFYDSATIKVVVTSKTGKTNNATVNVTNYTVSNATQLKEFADMVNNGKDFSGETIYQIGDIDLNPGKWSTNSEGITTFSSDAEQWKVIGKAEYNKNTGNTINEKKFSGVFNGNNYTINGLYIKNEQLDIAGLFGNNYGTIKNTILKNSSIDIRYHAGGIASGNAGNINNCKNYASVKGNFCLGGVCSWSTGTIQDCTNGGKIEGKNNWNKEMFIGGIAGWGEGTINKCGNHGKIYLEYSYSKQGMGGIAGQIKSGGITKCYNSGVIQSTTGESSEAGGIAGVADYGNEGTNPTISECYNSGSVIAVDNVGGILCWGFSGQIIDCYNTGTLTAETDIGGIAYKMTSAGSIVNCYSAGNILTSATNGVGALLGYYDYASEVTLTNNYAVLLGCNYAVRDRG